MFRYAPIVFIIAAIIVITIAGCSRSKRDQHQQQANIQTVVNTPGLIAFWDFKNSGDGTLQSYYDPSATDKSFPLYLRRIGDHQNYSVATWPYHDTSSLVQFDHSGPFGQALRLNQGHIYAAVPRHEFTGTPLDVSGKQPFTLVTWVKFTGKRHMVAGIWDEGGWQKYAGRRQVALFAGLFNQKGVIAHISATGAASYPQSTVDGAQYARLRAIDGQAFENRQWVTMAMTYDPGKQLVTAWLNGKMTPLDLNDPVTQDVFRYEEVQPANPFRFAHPVYSPHAFVLKYNGYNLPAEGVGEHRLEVDLPRQQITYRQEGLPGENRTSRHRINFEITRNGESMLGTPIATEVVDGQTITLPLRDTIRFGDEIQTTLETWQSGKWDQVGTMLRKEIVEGAPFTVGRALGLASEEIEHGSQLFLDGVAVFNRVLTAPELRQLSFGDRASNHSN